MMCSKKAVGCCWLPRVGFWPTRVLTYPGFDLPEFWPTRILTYSDFELPQFWPTQVLTWVLTRCALLGTAGHICAILKEHFGATRCSIWGLFLKSFSSLWLRLLCPRFLRPFFQVLIVMVEAPLARLLWLGSFGTGSFNYQWKLTLLAKKVFWNKCSVKESWLQILSKFCPCEHKNC